MAKHSKRRTRRKRSRGKTEPLWRRFLKELPIIAVGILLTFIFSNAGLLRKLETTALDTTMRLRHRRTDSEVAIVRITEDEYKNKHGGKSPLDPARVGEIIRAIALGKPKVIGVDLDTSAPGYKDLQIPASPPIVWARSAAYSNIKKQFRLFDVLGGKEPPPLTGLVVFKQDEDGAIRRYTRLCATDQGPVPSFPWAVVKQVPNETIRTLKESEDELMADYVESVRVNLPVEEVLAHAADEGYQNEGILKDKIVLLGGDYAVQDEHDTPVGWMLGVEALARMIETELQGGGTRPASALSILLLEILDGFILLILFRILNLRQALLAAFFAVPVLALLCSLVAFWSLAHWAYFVPILILVFFHQIYERGKEYFKKLPEQVADNLSGNG